MQPKRQGDKLAQVSRPADSANFDRHRVGTVSEVNPLGSADEPPALDHVQVCAPPGCEQAARRFYGDVLGLIEIEKPVRLRPQGGAWFALDGGQLHIGVSEPFVPARKAHPALRVDGTWLDALAARLSGAGATVEWDHQIDGVRRFFTVDPWGNRLEVLAVESAGGCGPAEV